MARASRGQARLRVLPAQASLDDVEQFAEGLSDTFLECRELGHLWRPATASDEGGYYQRTLRCSRCRAERIESISLRGEVLSRSMKYPDGYLAQKIGRIVGDGRGVLRLTSLRRTVATATRRQAKGAS